MIDNTSYKIEFKVVDSTNRRIEGIATSPTIDKEKEIILKSAVESALPYFMKLPVMTYEHSERVVGMYDEFKFLPNGGLFVKGWIKDTRDADDVWDEILKGEINSFSIFGRRLKGNEVCKQHPTLRTSACITDELYIDAITLCSDNAINPDAGFNIVKSIIEGKVYKSEDTNSSLIHVAADGVKFMPEDERQEIEKEGVTIESISSKLDILISLLQGTTKKAEEEEEEVEKGCETTNEDVEKMDETKESEAVLKTKEPTEETEEVAKAEVPEDNTKEVVEEVIKSEVPVEVITKADVISIISKLDALAERLDKVENEPIAKSVVIIQDEGAKPQTNYSAIEAFKRGK